jgi:phosphatidylglycerol---prolipoprotein diacylglyceryl transferase
MPEGILIHIGSFSYTIHFYGIILMLGALAGAFLARSEAERRGEDPEIIWDMFIYLLIGGLVGARLWHIFSPPPTSLAQGITTAYYLTHPLAAIAIWNGGLGIPGAVIGGGVAMYFYARRHHLDFVVWLDIAAPGVALGQAIGRWGNFFNQELYGTPTNLPWKIYIDPAHRMNGFENDAYYHPLFAYESLLDLGNLLFLLWLTRHYPNRLKKGDVFNVYLITYPVIRFSLDFLRLDASRILNININQTVSAVVAIVAAGVLIWRHRSQSPRRAQRVEAMGGIPAQTGSLATKASRNSTARKIGKAARHKSSARKSATVKKPSKKPPLKRKAQQLEKSSGRKTST